MYPACALLVGIYIYHWLEGKTLVSPWWNKFAFGSGICIGIAMVMIGALCFYFLISPKEVFIPIVLGLIFVIGSTYCLMSLKMKSPMTTLVRFTLTAILFTGFLHIVGLERISKYHPARDIGRAIQERQAAEDVPIRVITYSCFRQSWVFYAGRPVERWKGTPDDLARLLEDVRPEVVIAPAVVAEGIVVPPEYRQQVFRDFKLPKRPLLIMFIRNSPPAQ
jgi:hypothetical protein